MVSPTGIAEFDGSEEKRHLYDMTDGSQQRLTLGEARRLLISDGAAPFILGAPRARMPNAMLSGAATEPTTECGASPRPPRTRG